MVAYALRIWSPSFMLVASTCIIARPPEHSGRSKFTWISNTRSIFRKGRRLWSVKRISQARKHDRLRRTRGETNDEPAGRYATYREILERKTRSHFFSWGDLFSFSEKYLWPEAKSRNAPSFGLAQKSNHREKKPITVPTAVAVMSVTRLASQKLRLRHRKSHLPRYASKVKTAGGSDFGLRLPSLRKLNRRWHMIWQTLAMWELPIPHRWLLGEV